uniref:VIT domain-containing protein n=1 Tax=Timema douglasi TaxID=61478 RepID=A0A7R8VB89_TIMDO|nr:unnamed protein product [Timema douglasi]
MKMNRRTRTIGTEEESQLGSIGGGVLKDVTITMSYYLFREVDGIEYKGVLDKTEAAQEQFKSAKLKNKTAFLMRLSSSNELTITVNVEIYKDLTFKLTYDDFLREIVNHYEHEIPIIYGKIVEGLHVEAQIQGSYDITTVNIPYLPGSLAGTQGAESGLKLERLQPNVVKVVWDPTRSEQEKLHKTPPLLLSFDLDKKSLPGQVLKSIPDVLKERVSIKKMVDGFMKDTTKQLQALELSLKHNFLSQLTAFYAVKLKD